MTVLSLNITLYRPLWIVVVREQGVHVLVAWRHSLYGTFRMLRLTTQEEACFILEETLPRLLDTLRNTLEFFLHLRIHARVPCDQLPKPPHYTAWFTTPAF